MPKACSAESRCSTVLMLAPSFDRVVAYSVSATCETWAGISFSAGRVRKWRPESGGSGCSTMPVRVPE